MLCPDAKAESAGVLHALRLASAVRAPLQHSAYTGPANHNLHCPCIALWCVHTAEMHVMLMQAAMLARGRQVRQSRLLFYAKMAEKALQTYERDGWGEFPTHINLDRREVRCCHGHASMLGCMACLAVHPSMVRDRDCTLADPAASFSGTLSSQLHKHGRLQAVAVATGQLLVSCHLQLGSGPA